MNTNLKTLNPNEKPTMTFNLSLLAGILILINSALVGVSARWFPGIIPTLPGSSANDATTLYILSSVGLVCGVLVLLGAIMLHAKPVNRKSWGLLVVAFSVPSVIAGGGFIAGFILGILGGKAAFQPKTETQSTKPKQWLPKMTDSANKMRIEGAGPKIMAPLLVTFALTAAVSYLYQPMFNYPLASAEWTLALGILLLTVGMPFWLLSAGMFFRAWQQERLETRGPFAVMPNPIYASFIVFVIPSLSLLLNWWPILLTSVVMYAAQQIFIHEEDAALREKFGRQYEEYRKKVLLKFL